MAHKHKARVVSRGRRFRGRCRAVELLFEAECRDTDPVALAEERQLFAEELSRGEGGMSLVSDYTIQIVSGVAESLDEIDDLISQNLVGWELSRLPSLNRNILRLAVWELLYADDVDLPVTISQAMKIASLYSDDESPAFINKVLSNVHYSRTGEILPSPFEDSAEEASEESSDAPSETPSETPSEDRANVSSEPSPDGSSEDEPQQEDDVVETIDSQTESSPE